MQHGDEIPLHCCIAVQETVNGKVSDLLLQDHISSIHEQQALTINPVWRQLLEQSGHDLLTHLFLGETYRINALMVSNSPLELLFSLDCTMECLPLISTAQEGEKRDM